MWKISDIDSASTYVIQLCHDADGRRFLQLRNTTVSEPSHSSVVFETEPVPHNLLLERNMRQSSREIKLVTGGRFEVDAHNIWFTPQELDALEEDDCDFDAVNWSTPTPPILAEN